MNHHTTLDLFSSQQLWHYRLHTSTRFYGILNSSTTGPKRRRRPTSRTHGVSGLKKCWLL